MGGFVGLEALLVAHVLLTDGALGCGREDDGGVDFRGDEGREACVGLVLENPVGCAEHPVHGGVVRWWLGLGLGDVWEGLWLGRCIHFVWVGN